ncbi:interferon-gamma-inducible GTPase 10 [Engraulis encrasicolus]|uniref:interferon-gamma-inducible GTPase 10 n=1 Tax=Engraulis encrasicolus TaxID=184585 RepID=UPI002FCF565B
MPDLVGSSAACTAKAEQLDEDKTSALTEHIQNTEQHEEKKTLENGNECIGKNTVVPVADVPSQLESAETTQTKTGHQLAENDLPLNINVHQKKSVDGETQTEELSQETLPSDVSHDMEQSANPEQPYYVEPPAPEYQEHLYLEPDDIGLQEDPCVRQQVERLDHVTLNIAITGMTGAGKSTFINAVRGVDNDDENAAPTGATETTMSACAYRHPTMPNVSLWDLPGTGSPKFKAKKYLKEVKFETYDFFIIISSERFKENDLMLAQEILKKKKKFYFLRSKIDNDIRAEQFKKNFDVDKLIACIREDLTAHLKRCIVTPTVFLVSSFDLDKYDFPILVDTLIADLPAHKREALILSLPIYSTQMLERKIKSFEKTALKAAKAASGISMAPIPGLAVACDAGILLAFFSKCYHALGLDDKSLDKLSERVNNNSLKALRETRPFVMAIRNNELSGRELSALGSKRSALEFAYSLVPVWGSKRAANMSHSATLGLLNEGLKELSDTAREVLKVAKIDHIKGPCP